MGGNIGMTGYADTAPIDDQSAMSPAEIMFGETQEASRLDQSQKLEASLAADFHDGFVAYMVRNRVDSTYIVIANVHYNHERILALTSDPAERERLIKEFKTYMEFNKSQSEETDRLRMQYATDLSN